MVSHLLTFSLIQASSVLWHAIKLNNLTVLAKIFEFINALISVIGCSNHVWQVVYKYCTTYIYGTPSKLVWLHYKPIFSQLIKFYRIKIDPGGTLIHAYKQKFSYPKCLAGSKVTVSFLNHAFLPKRCLCDEFYEGR